MPDSDEVEILELRIKPQHIKTASARALQVNGYTEEGWHDAIDIETAIAEIAKFLKGCVMVGHSVQFDVNFLREAAMQHNAGLIPFRTIDTHKLAEQYLKPKGLDSLSLEAACEFLGISNKNAHTAMADAVRCKLVYDKIMEDLGGDE